MFDRYNRDITYIRISVTDRCNLSCFYCSPKECSPSSSEKTLSTQEILKVVRAGVKIGISKVRLTGGEPLVRPGIVDLVCLVAAEKGVTQLAMTTNGTRLERHAEALARAGLNAVNVSLDTLDPERYSQVTRGGRVEVVLRGIESARRTGIAVKINSVVLRDTSATDIAELRDFCSFRGIKHQTIRAFSLLDQKSDGGEYDRPLPCEECNRIRLLASGVLKPCLHSDDEVRLDFQNLEESLREAILAKPRCGQSCTSRGMVEIGG